MMKFFTVIALILIFCWINNTRENVILLHEHLHTIEEIVVNKGSDNDVTP